VCVCVCVRARVRLVDSKLITQLKKRTLAQSCETKQTSVTLSPTRCTSTNTQCTLRRELGKEESHRHPRGCCPSGRRQRSRSLTIPPVQCDTTQHTSRAKRHRVTCSTQKEPLIEMVRFMITFRFRFVVRFGVEGLFSVCVRGFMCGVVKWCGKRTVRRHWQQLVTACKPDDHYSSFFTTSCAAWY
jgi:hypothetical protein